MSSLGVSTMFALSAWITRSQNDAGLMVYAPVLVKARSHASDVYKDTMVAVSDHTFLSLVLMALRKGVAPRTLAARFKIRVSLAEPSVSAIALLVQGSGIRALTALKAVIYR